MPKASAIPAGGARRVQTPSKRSEFADACTSPGLPTIDRVATPDHRTAARPAARIGSAAGRLARAWKVMPHERRLAAFASVGLFLTLFLPWYQETVLIAGRKPQTASTSVTGWGAFSFVEAATLLVAAAVLTLLFQRAEGKAFHLPGGDGVIVMIAGLWTCLLVVWRIFDKQSTSVHGAGATISGIEWGIFVALAVAAFLVYGGSRIRASHRPEPPLPGERGSATPAGAPYGDAGEGELRSPGPMQAEPGAAPPRPPSRRAPGWLTAPPRHRLSEQPRSADPTPPEKPRSEAPTLPVAPSTPAAESDA
jgi:hypothetical protein